MTKRLTPINKEMALKPSGKRKRLYESRNLLKDVGASNDVIQRAEKLEAELASEFPSFIKLMLHSHVSRGFWLGLPRNFCNLHLPNHDAMIALEDENGEVSQSKFLSGKGGLSGGWRGFSIVHGLNEGDVLVFHLVSPFKFKIYVIRSNSSDEVHCARGLLKLQADDDHVEDSLKTLLDGKSDGDEVYDDRKTSYQSDKDSVVMSPDVLDGIKLSDSVIAFQEMRSIKDFHVLVNGLVINSEFSKYSLGKYYELCSSRNAFLHEKLLEGLNCKLVVGIISETINVADAIRASQISSSVSDFSIWEKTLLAFEGLGMEVGFLRARLAMLVNLAVKSNELEIVFKEVAGAPW